MAKEKIKALAYLRTSSATNVGEGKDSDKRQLAAINGFADRSGYEIVGSYYDPAVSGSDPLEDRPGFKAMLAHIEGNGVRHVIVEAADRFARDLLIQEVGVTMLNRRGVTLLDARGEHLTATDDEIAVFRRQQDGSIAQLIKTRIVKQLRQARERKRIANAKDGVRVLGSKRGKCEGRKSLFELRPDTIRLARRLNRPGGLSLRQIAAELAQRGHRSETGAVYTAKSVSRMITPKG